MLKYYRDLVTIPDKPNVVLNVGREHIGLCRNGDLIAVCNMVEYLRRREGRRDIQFFFKPNTIYCPRYCWDFVWFLTNNTDYFSKFRGDQDVDIPHPVNLWNYRGAVGDCVSLNIPRIKEEKVAIFPVWDAPYNTYRNWNSEITQIVIDRFYTTEFKNHKKVLCISGDVIPNVDTKSFEISRDFMTNVEHILSCEHYAGGDTGMSHFAGALKDHPIRHYYTHGEESRLHTTPFNFMNGWDVVMYS